MRIIGMIVVACVVLAALRLAVGALLVVYFLLLIYAAITKPAETLGFLAFFLVAWLLHEHTLAALGTFVALCIVGSIAKARKD